MITTFNQARHFLRNMGCVASASPYRRRDNRVRYWVYIDLNNIKAWSSPVPGAIGMIVGNWRSRRTYTAQELVQACDRWAKLAVLQ